MFGGIDAISKKKKSVFFLGIFFFSSFHIFCADSMVEDFVDNYQSNLQELKENLDILFKKSIGRCFGEFIGLTTDKSSYRMDIRWHALELISYLEDRGRRESLNPDQIREPILNLFRSYKKPLDVYKKQLNELWDALAFVSVFCRHYSRIENEGFVVNILQPLRLEVGIDIRR